MSTSSPGQTPELARSRNCKVITINRADFDHGTTRILVVSEVSSEFIVFLTHDAVCADEHTLAELIKPLVENENIAAAYGRQLAWTDVEPIEKFAREFNYSDKSLLKSKADLPNLGIKTFFCSNSCAAYRRSIFEKHGGF